MNKYANISTTERALSVAAGIGLVAVGRTTSRRFVKGLGWMLVGRGISGICPVNALVGRDSSSASSTREALGGPRGIRVEVSTTVRGTPEAIYAYWRDLENLPLFMAHLKQVTEVSPNSSHWVARGPMDASIEWDAKLIEDLPGELISWATVGDGDVACAGSVRFVRLRPGRTEVRVLLQYEPAGGRLGDVVAKLFGKDPHRSICEDLDRFKQLVETGEIASARSLAGTQAVAPNMRASSYGGATSRAFF